MNAHELKQAPYTEWTFQQKYQRMRPRDLIEVRLVSHTGAEPRWIKARIKDTNKGGAFVKVVEGHLERFFKFTDCRPCAEPDTQKPIATLAEIAKGQLPALAAPPPPPQRPLPVFAAPVESAPPEPPAPTTPPLVLFRREPPTMPDDKRSRTPHPDTDGNGKIITSRGFARALPNRVSNDPRALGSRIGALINETRKVRGITQLGLADRSTEKNRPRGGSTVFNSRVSQIELGKTLPTDDELLAIAEALDLSLEKMIDLRDMDRGEREAEARARKEESERWREKEERAAREARDAVRRGNVIPNASRPPEPPPPQATYRDPVFYAPPPEPEPERRSAVYPAPEQRLVNARQPAPMPAPIAAMQMEFAGFMESLIGLVPVPTDGDLRKRWFACAMELYKLSGGAS